MSGNRPHILIADDHTLVAELCKKLLETEFDVVGTVGDGRALVCAAAELRPDVVLVDITMPILNGLDAGEQIKAELPRTKLVFLTMNSNADVAAEAFRRGASAYLLKKCAASELVTSVRRVLRGYTLLSRNISEAMVSMRCRREMRMAEEDVCLTKRQREVLQLLAEGKVMKEVAQILNMSPRTVAYHKYRIMDVLGAKNGAELVRYAVRNNMIAA